MKTADRVVLDRIHELAEEERTIYGKPVLSLTDIEALNRIQSGLDRCWDELGDLRAQLDADP
jgi:hypothetical protein